MSKVYLIYKLFHNDSVEASMNWPYIDSYVEKLFTSREDAEKWVDSRFTTFLNEEANFYDLQIVEKDVEEEIADEAKGALAIGFWVSARVWITLRGCKVVEMDFRKERGDDEENAYWIDDDEIRVFYKLPPFRTRTEVVEFVEKKVGEFNKKKK